MQRAPGSRAPTSYPLNKIKGPKICFLQDLQHSANNQEASSNYFIYKLNII